MPQLDISTFLPQVFWLLITFSALYILMSRFALPRVGEILEERQNRLDIDLEQAEKYKVESEQLEVEYDKLTAEARAEAQAHLRAEKERLDAKLSEKQAELSAKTDARLAEAEGKITDAKFAAMGNLEVIATEACILIVAQLSGKKPASGNAKAAVKAEMGK